MFYLFSSPDRCFGNLLVESNWAFPEKCKFVGKRLIAKFGVVARKSEVSESVKEFLMY
jgi:hypothetical protein